MKKISFVAFAALLCSKAALADSLASGTVSDQLDMDDEFVTGLTEPTGMAFLPDGRMLITLRGVKQGQSGQAEVLIVPADGGEPVSAGGFEVGMSFQEKGLLNVAVHPDFANNRTIFLYYSHWSGSANTDDNRVVSMKLGEDDKLDLASEKILIEGVAAPANHDGGGLAVHGNYLFIGTGDSGQNSQAVPYAQKVTNYWPTCLTNLNGKILRLNVDGTIPEDNPLVGKMVSECGGTGTKPTALAAAREEIFAWGFRNAFRVWADPPTGNLWVGHVGEVTFEMINVVPPTGNKHFGWPFREGGEGFPVGECQNYTPNVGDCVDPVYRCEQSDGQNGTIPDIAPCNGWGNECDNPDVPNQCDSITGGVILNGCEWPADFKGKYVFGDYSSKNVWTLPVNDTHDNVLGERVNFMTPQAGPVAFAEYKGALYVLEHSNMNGKVSKITPRMSNAACGGTEPDPSMTPDAGSPMQSATGMMPMPTASAAEMMPTAQPSASSPPSATALAASTSTGMNPMPNASSSSSTSAPPTGSPTTSAASTSMPTAAPTNSSAPVAVAPGANDAKGCGCEVIGTRRSNSFAALAVAGLALGFVGRRRHSRKS